MSRDLILRFVSRLFVLFVMASGAVAQTPSKQSPIVAGDAEVNGVKIHYLTAGKGPAVILPTATPKPRACGSRSFPSLPRNLP
jgi:hypothetical protein